MAMKLLIRRHDLRTGLNWKTMPEVYNLDSGIRAALEAVKDDKVHVCWLCLDDTDFPAVTITRGVVRFDRTIFSPEHFEE
jgi:hypothetical protein